MSRPRRAAARRPLVVDSDTDTANDDAASNFSDNTTLSDDDEKILVESDTDVKIEPAYNREPPYKRKRTAQNGHSSYDADVKIGDTKPSAVRRAPRSGMDLDHDVKGIKNEEDDEDDVSIVRYKPNEELEVISMSPSSEETIRRIVSNATQRLLSSGALEPRSEDPFIASAHADLDARIAAAQAYLNGASEAPLQAVDQSVNVSMDDMEIDAATFAQALEEDGDVGFYEPAPYMSDHESDDEFVDMPVPGREDDVVQVRRRNQRRMNMLKKQSKVNAQLDAFHHSVDGCWHRLDTEKRPAKRADKPNGLLQNLLPFQLEGLNWLSQQEAGAYKGGILADEMGMGKTIQMIALILSTAAPGHTTLVIAPTVAVVQWCNEIAKYAPQLNVHMFYGASRTKDTSIFESHDVVVTSFAVVESCFRRQAKGFTRKGRVYHEPSPLHEMHWHRIILDEAHNIKERASNTSKAAFQLEADFRWCLSGTPLQNRVGELYSLLRFMRIHPYALYLCKQCDCESYSWQGAGHGTRGRCDQCGHVGGQHICFWNHAILRPLQRSGAQSMEGRIAFRRLSALLNNVMLRRTKVERADDMGLPPRMITVRRDYFAPEEEELYLSLFKKVRRKFSTYVSEGTILNNYSNLFTLITRMRQMADHPDLVLRRKNPGQDIKLDSKDKVDTILTCRICLEEAEDPVVSLCHHIFCRACVTELITEAEESPFCPTCNAPLSVDLEQETFAPGQSSSALETGNDDPEFPELSAPQADGSGSSEPVRNHLSVDKDPALVRQGLLGRINPSTWRTSTKIEALVDELSKLRTSDRTLKSLVFSQFTTFLDLISRRLTLAGFKIVRLQGSMTPEARNNTIQRFMTDPDTTVFLISLKAGGVALNLTEASHVFIMDPWWNPAIELQAMDRIHRLGQVRPVHVTRFVIENSIESRIIDLQRKKESMVASALGDDTSASGTLTPDDFKFLFTM